MMLKNKTAVVTLFFLLPLLFSAGCGRRGRVVGETRFLMGTTVDVTVRHENAALAEEAAGRAFREAERLSAMLTIFDEDSEVSIINRSAGIRAVEVSEETFFVLKRAVEYSRMSGGAFDVTVLPLLELWGFKNGGRSIPSAEEIEEALSLVGYENIVMDEENLSVKLEKQGMRIDLGGIAKGFVADRMGSVLEESGATGALINAGGDIYALGTSTGGNPWRIGIRHPRDKDEIVDVIPLENRAVATSGDYEDYFIFDGERYSHIFDPVSGMPVKGMMSVTVIAGSAIEADALSTMVFVLGEEEGRKIADELGAEVLFFTEE